MKKAKEKKKRAWNTKSFVIATLRRATYRLPARSECLRLARIARNQYACASCRGVFSRRDIQVDHIKPVVVPSDGFQGFDSFIERLFCDSSGLQVLCKPCHRDKTKRENEQRRAAREALKVA